MYGFRDRDSDLERLQVPYFVYGTLRPAFHNSGIWKALDARCEHDGAAWVPGFQMFGDSIPFAVRSHDPGHRVVGALIYPPDEEWAAERLRINFDNLEGHPTGYQRMTTIAHTPDGRVHCWIYSPTAWHPGGNPEPTGDYFQLLARRRAEREALAQMR